MSKQLVIQLPKLHPRQQEIADSPAKRVITCTGRQFGKTTLAAHKSLTVANEGGKVLYCAPIQSQTDAYWNLLTAWLWPAIQHGLVYRNDTKRLLKWTKNGSGQIVAKTAHLPDHLRGDNCDLLLLDEFAYQDPAVWDQVTQPMLARTDGTAHFYSTANHRNHFYLLALKAQACEDGSWAFYTAPSTANPTLSPEVFENFKRDMTAEVYSQEVLGLFAEGAGAVFTLFADDFLDMVQTFTEHKDHRLVAGLDWGLVNDWTGLSIGCATCSRELLIERMKGGTYPNQISIIGGILSRFENPKVEILAEENTIGKANIAQMRAEGFRVRGVVLTNASKSQLVQNLRLVFEQRQWKWIKDMVAWRELEAFQGKVSSTGLVTYSAPPPIHDDTVIARLLMMHQAKAGTLVYGGIQ